MPQSFQGAGKSHCHTAIFSAVLQIPLPSRNLFSCPAYHCCALIFLAVCPFSSPRCNHFSGLAIPISLLHSFQWAGESHCRATIILEGRRPIPRHHLFSGPVNPIAAPQPFLCNPVNPIMVPPSFKRAGDSHCRAAIFLAVRRIPLPCRNLSSGPANPIAMLQSFQWSGKSHRCATIFSAVL